MQNDFDQMVNRHGICPIELVFQEQCTAERQTVTGRVAAGEDGAYAQTIQFVSDDYGFISEEIPLQAGGFTAVLPTGREGALYWIYLRGRSRDLLPCQPESCSIQRVKTRSSAKSSSGVLPHSIGIAVAPREGAVEQEDEIECACARGSILPLRKEKGFLTAVALDPADPETCLPVCIFLGMGTHPSELSSLCQMILHGGDLKRPLPKGSRIEVVLEINEALELMVSVRIPDHGVQREIRADVARDWSQTEALKLKVLQQFELSPQATTAPSPVGRSLSDAIQGTIEQLKGSEQALSRSAEDLLEWARQLEQEKSLQELRSRFWEQSFLVANFLEDGAPEESLSKYKRQFEQLHVRGLRALANRDLEDLGRVEDQLTRLEMRYRTYDPRFLVPWVQDVIQRAEKEEDSTPAFLRMVEMLKKALEQEDAQCMLQHLKALSQLRGRDVIYQERGPLRSGIMHPRAACLTPQGISLAKENL